MGKQVIVILVSKIIQDYCKFRPNAYKCANITSIHEISICIDTQKYRRSGHHDLIFLPCIDNYRYTSHQTVSYIGILYIGNCMCGADVGKQFHLQSTQRNRHCRCR